MLLTGTVPCLEKQIFGTFLHNKLTNSQTHSLTDRRKGRVTELHVAAKKESDNNSDTTDDDDNNNEQLETDDLEEDEEEEYIETDDGDDECL